jgi:hypothetical protein
MDWLPSSGLKRSIPSSRPNPPQVVSEFIDSMLASWDRVKLMEFFTPLDVNLISSIPLTTRQQQDFWAWHFEKRGVFSVYSAYRMLAHRKSLAGSAGPRTDKQFRRSGLRCGELKSLPKWWRLARCSLPSKDLLLHRNMADSSACPICGTGDLWRHSPLECNMARCVWALEEEEITEHIKFSFRILMQGVGWPQLWNLWSMKT